MKKLSLLTLIILLCGCNENVTFDEAQPSHLEALKAIPQAYHGSYFDESDSSFLYVDELTIAEKFTAELDYPLVEFLDEIQEDEDLGYVKIVAQTKEQLSIQIGETQVQSFDIRNDSIFGKVEIMDTLFCIKHQDVVKAYKDDHYFNILNKNGDFALRKVNLESGNLVISKIQKVLDVKQLMALENTTGHTGKGLKPTKRQFKKIAKSSFTENKRLRKVE
ncbi:hypothetical protein [Roseivirga misakiensis]|uniref:Uncharacterized protein n=1 Tax=Roseivirga misakiensis TaxID=1563681 RepID=A0A1E5T0X0_9BACT|nr:hypothetical protein [Roseivirga misakiensis]OEK05006.1 hypothetical protein BFP71_16420 [Roseivirga misakiensis]